MSKNTQDSVLCRASRLFHRRGTVRAVGDASGQIGQFDNFAKMTKRQVFDLERRRDGRKG